MLRKTCIRLAIATKSGIGGYMATPLRELAEIIEDVQEVTKEQ